MDSVIKEVRAIAKFESFTIDNWVFQLHYILTALILFGFSILVTTGQFFGDPINCMATTKYDDGIPEKVLNNYCWIQCTFTLPKSYVRATPWDIIQPGVRTRTGNDEPVYHAYYQWVCFFFALQGAMFYVPRYIWKSFEHDHCQNILLGLDYPFQGTKEKIKILVKYLTATRGKHTSKAYMYFLCEVLNVVNVIGQIFFTDAFLGHEFTTYGREVIEFAQTDQSNRTDPMIQIFPRVTKCAFRQYGVAGTVQNHDALCILPINMINEKFFIFLWFWFILLAIVSGLNVIYRIFFISDWVKCKRLSIRLSQDATDKITDIINDSNITIGDTFLLLTLKKHLAPLNFETLITEFHKKWNSTEEDDEENEDEEETDTRPFV